jgi:hypothetical protein
MVRKAEPTVVLLEHADGVIQAALLRLLEKPKEHRPFVIIEDAATGKFFVQFAGSDREHLIFDVPRYKITTRFRFTDRNFRHDDVAALARYAVEVLGKMGLTKETLVRISEEAGTGNAS